MRKATAHNTRILSRRGNVVAVDFHRDPPPRFPGGAAMRELPQTEVEDHPDVIRPDDEFFAINFGRRAA
jgi:hypothetical protein